jgi:aerobic-type carbon monoxide dehydrogenase small subunit (CoxS/CutS family)
MEELGICGFGKKNYLQVITEKDSKVMLFKCGYCTKCKWMMRY